MGPEIDRIAWKLQSGLPQDVLVPKNRLCGWTVKESRMNYNLAFPSLRRIVEKNCQKIGAANLSRLSANHAVHRTRNSTLLQHRWIDRFLCSRLRFDQSKMN